MLSKGDVEKVIVVNKETVEVYIKPSKIGTGRYIDNTSGGFFKQQNQILFKIGSVESFEKQMAELRKVYLKQKRPQLFMKPGRITLVILSCIFFQ